MLEGVTVERLTLSETAERLGISKEAVRQQVEHSILPHGKWPDGGTYVCIEAESETEKDGDSKESGRANQDQGPSWWNYVAGASGLIALVGGMTYGLGLLALWIPISRTYTHDLTAAWYAASLAPKTMVAGLGGCVRKLL